jgi:hypothetical protein
MYRLLIVSLMTFTSVLASHAAFAQQAFDGRWSIKAIPERGACRRAQYYTVVVENGVPRNAVSRRTTDRVSGRLEPNGRVQISVQRDRAQVAITGKLVQLLGSGTWAIAGSIACSGRWTASKWG